MASMACRMGLVATILLGMSSTMACGGRAANAPSAAAGDDDDDATVGLIEHHRYHHHGGVSLFIAMSLDTLAISPDQRGAVEKIRADLHARMEPAHVAEQNLQVVLADGVAAGSFDAPKVEAAVAQLTAAGATVHDASADALNQLHEILTPAQRAALVDKVSAHWAVWQNANAEEHHLALLMADLELTPDQVQKIRAGLGDGMKAVPKLDSQEITTHLHAFDAAFRSEKFDAKALTTGGAASAHMIGWSASTMAHFVETVSPVLGPEQRAKLASHLRDHASHDPSAQAKT